MRDGDPSAPGLGPEAAVATRRADRGDEGSAWIIETTVSPFHCLYQDALDFHKQSHLRLSRSEAEASRLARAALLLYLESAEALIHQAAAELARPELGSLLTNPARPMPSMTVWTLLPSLIGASGVFDSDAPPWPQLAELLALRAFWTFPGPAPHRKAYYHSPHRDGNYEPLELHQIPAGVALNVDVLVQPLTGLPRDPYALRPRHLDTARSVLDQAIEALDRRLGGLLTKDGRHRLEPVRLVHPKPPA